MGGNVSKEDGSVRKKKWTIEWKVENESIEWLEYPDADSYTVFAKVKNGRPSSFDLPKSARHFKLNKKSYERSDVVELYVIANKDGKMLKKSKGCLSLYIANASRYKKPLKNWQVEWKEENLSVQWCEYPGSESYAIFAKVDKGKPSTYEVPFDKTFYKLNKSKYANGDIVSVSVIAYKGKEVLGKTDNSLDIPI